jgi:hypothetical protein
LDHPLAPGSALTWFQLLEQIFPGLEKPLEGAIEAVAPATVPVRHLDRDYETQALSGPLKFQVVSGLPYKAWNRRSYLLHLDLLGQTSGGQGSTIEAYSLRSDYFSNCTRTGVRFLMVLSTGEYFSPRRTSSSFCSSEISASILKYTRIS